VEINKNLKTNRHFTKNYENFILFSCYLVYEAVLFLMKNGIEKIYCGIRDLLSKSLLEHQQSIKIFNKKIIPRKTVDLFYGKAPPECLSYLKPNLHWNYIKLGEDGFPIKE